MAGKLHGVIPIIPTAFEADQQVDHDGTARLVRYAVACGAHAVALPAFGSEYYKLSEDERVELVATAVAAAEGRVPVVGMANHPGAIIAAELARRTEAAGADVVGVALPRAFPVSDDDLLRYACTVADAVEVPVLIQDWNAGGPTVGAEFCVKLRERCPNVRYLKLEEPRLGPKLRAIIAATGGELSILEGWGGLFMLELIPHGCAGSMPGLALCDVLVKCWDLMTAGEAAEAFRLFSEVMPYIYHSLHDFELYHTLEKRLLSRRGALAGAKVRELTTLPTSYDDEYFEFLCDRLFETLDRHGFALRPLG